MYDRAGLEIGMEFCVSDLMVQVLFGREAYIRGIPYILMVTVFFNIKLFDIFSAFLY